MDERLIREALRSDCRGAGDPAMSALLAQLEPDIARAAARLKARREARRQNLMFFVCACAFAVAVGFAALDWSRGGKAFWEILMGGGALMGLILALSPLMAYWLEREREHEKA